MVKPKKLLASAAVAAALVGGSVTGLILGVPGISAAQTTTAPDSPSTTVAADPGQPNPVRPPHEGNCPNMGGSSSNEAPSRGTSGNIAFRRAAPGQRF